MSKKIIIIIVFILIGILVFINIQRNKSCKIEIINTEIDIQNISILIKEKTITNIDFILESENEFVYSISSGEDYTISKLEKDNWKQLNIKGKWNGTELEMMRPATKKIEESINWNDKYGKLGKGKYKLDKEIFINNIKGKISIEFEIK